MKREALQTAEVVIDAKSPAEAKAIADGMNDVVIWRTVPTAIYPSHASVWEPDKRAKKKARR
jgi:hypothetical protein